VYTQGRERLRRTLTEPDIAKTRGLGRVEDVVYGIGYIVPCEIVETEIPEFDRVGVAVETFLGVFVTAVVA
jgi:hypothetical protein